MSKKRAGKTNTKAKKQFGQNFLTNKGIVRRMALTTVLAKTDTVLEIGPGRGILTEELLNQAGKVIAVEKDRDLIGGLREKFAKEISEKQLILVNSDIRDLDLKSYKLRASSYKLVSNIPYYITGEILRVFLEHKIYPSTVVLMVQKEIAQRIVARDGKESILSNSIKAYGRASLIAYVSRGNFNPAPNVDSAIIMIDRISKDFFKGFSEKKFFDVLKTGFAHKRKFLLSNLTVLISGERLKRIFDKAGVPTTARPEDISLSDWASLAQKI